MRVSPVAFAPTLSDNDRRTSRRIAVPPNEIIRRPIVTRNPTANSSNQVGTPRERHLITPRKPAAVTQGPSMIERGPERGVYRRPTPPAPSGDSQTGADSGGERRAQKIRVTLPSPTEKVDNNESNERRKRTREGDPAAERPAPRSEGTVDGNGGERRYRRPDPSATPAPKENKARTEEPARPRDNGSSTPRAEQRQEHQAPPKADPPHEQRHQEKEQRQERQPQQDQRKKP